VDVWYHVGPANQTPGRSGFAHLFEHMMFSGSKHVRLRLSRCWRASGPAASTGPPSFDRTNYFEVVPSSQLAAALWIESDRMGFLLDTLDEKKLRVQRDVVSNEKRQNYDNALRPFRVAPLRSPLPEATPYYECVIGDIADIQAASVHDVKQFFSTWYGPQNASARDRGGFQPQGGEGAGREVLQPVHGA